MTDRLLSLSPTISGTMALLIACRPACPDSKGVRVQSAVYPLEPVEEGIVDLRWSGFGTVNNEVVVQDLDGNIITTQQSEARWDRCVSVVLTPGLYRWAFSGASDDCPESSFYRTDWTPLEVVPFGSPDVGENGFPPCENGA